jgi:hypothetical protein
MRWSGGDSIHTSISERLDKSNLSHRAYLPSVARSASIAFPILPCCDVLLGSREDRSVLCLQYCQSLAGGSSKHK